MLEINENLKTWRDPGFLKRKLSKWRLNQLVTVGWAESTVNTQHIFTSVIYSKITKKCPNKCQFATVNNFNLNFLLRTLGQFWLADKNGVVFQKGSTYLKMGDLLFFCLFKLNFAKCGLSPGWLDHPQTWMDNNSAVLWLTETHSTFLERSKPLLLIQALSKRLVAFLR